MSGSKGLKTGILVFMDYACMPAMHMRKKFYEGLPCDGWKLPQMELRRGIASLVTVTAGDMITIRTL